MQNLNEIIQTCVLNGNLEVIALIGLNSDMVFPLIQYYVDKSGDI